MKAARLRRFASGIAPILLVALAHVPAMAQLSVDPESTDATQAPPAQSPRQGYAPPAGSPHDTRPPPAQAPYQDQGPAAGSPHATRAPAAQSPEQDQGPGATRPNTELPPDALQRPRF